jgi:hypothetical protein
VRPSPRTSRIPGRRRPRPRPRGGTPASPFVRVATPAGGRISGPARPSPRPRVARPRLSRPVPGPASPASPHARCGDRRGVRVQRQRVRWRSGARGRGAHVHSLSVLPRSGGSYAARKCTHCTLFRCCHAQVGLTPRPDECSHRLCTIFRCCHAQVGLTPRPDECSHRLCTLHRCCHAQVGLTPRPDECSHTHCTGSTRSRGPRRADTSTRILGGAVTLGWAASSRRVHASTLPGVDTRRWAASRRHTEWPVVRLPSGTCAAWRTRGGMLARRRGRTDTYTYTAGSARRWRLPLAGPGPGAPAAPAACSSRPGRREWVPVRAAPSGRAWRHPTQAAVSEFQGRSFLQTGAANRNADAAPLPAGCLSGGWDTGVLCARL